MFKNKAEEERFERERILGQHYVITPDGTLHLLSTVELYPGWGYWSFETMLFNRSNEEISPWIEELCERYMTKEDALFCHAWLKEILEDEGLEGYEEKPLYIRKRETKERFVAEAEELLFT